MSDDNTPPPTGAPAENDALVDGGAAATDKLAEIAARLSSKAAAVVPAPEAEGESEPETPTSTLGKRSREEDGSSTGKRKKITLPAVLTGRENLSGKSANAPPARPRARAATAVMKANALTQLASRLRPLKITPSFHELF